MSRISARTAKALAALSVSAGIALSAALTGCTTASQTETGAPTASASFDPANLAKNESLAARVPASIKSKGTLVIGTGTGYAPAEFTGGADGQTSMGYGIDVGKAIAATLGLKPQFQIAAFPSILPGLGAKYDLGIASFSITPERLKAVNMVTYFDAGVQWAVQKGNPHKVSLDDVCGKTIGVQTGTVEEDPILSDRAKACLTAGKPAIKVVSLKTQADVTTRLVNGGLDAMLADSPITYYAIAQTKDQLEPLGGIQDSVHEGIAVAKDDTAFAELVSDVVNTMISDGSYQKILASWSNSKGAIDKSEVNPVVKD